MRPIWSHMRPNFSMVQLKQNLRSHKLKKIIKKTIVSATLKVSLWFNNRHTLGSYRGLNQSEIMKGGPPPLIGRGPDIPVRVCTCENACVAAVRERGVVEMCAVLPT